LSWGDLHIEDERRPFRRVLILVAVLHLVLLLAFLIAGKIHTPEKKSDDITWLDGGGDSIAAQKTEPEEKHTAPEPTPEPPTPAPTPQATPEATPEPVPTAPPSEIVETTPTPAPTPTAAPTPTPQPSPTPKPTAKPSPRPTPTAKPKPKPTPTAKPKPKPSPAKKSAGEDDDEKPAKKPTSTPAKKKTDGDEESGKSATKTSGTSSGDKGTQPGTGGGNRGGAGKAGGGNREGEYGWYFSMLKDRFDARWKQPTSIVQSDQRFVTTVKLRIGKDGTLSEVGLANSSGNVVMDDSVLEAVRSVRQIDPLPAGLGNGDFYEININFELKQNQ
jgi:TonB family protein